MSETTPSTSRRAVTTGTCRMPRSTMSSITSPAISVAGTVKGGAVIARSTGASRSTSPATARTRRS